MQKGVAVIPKELFGILAALGWSLSSILIKRMAERSSVVALNAVRSALASAMLIALALLVNLHHRLNMPDAVALAWLVFSGVIGMAGGEAVYLVSLKFLDVSRAYPIAISEYAVFTFLLSVLLLGEVVTLGFVAGTVLVLAGVWLVAFPRRQPDEPPIHRTPGYVRSLLFASGGTFLWAVGVIGLKRALTTTDPITANAIRMPVCTVTLLLLMGVRGGGKELLHMDCRWIGLLALSGFCAYLLGGLMFLEGVKVAGAAKTAVLSSVSPLMTVALSTAFLGEKITARLAAGVVTCVVGVWLIVG